MTYRSSTPPDKKKHAPVKRSSGAHMQAGGRSSTSIVQEFQAQAARTPEAIALSFQAETLTYAELNERANRLGNYLRKIGVTTETPVGICVDRSLEMVVGILGILKAGGAYVPLDAAYPRERLEYMIEDSRIQVLLVTGAHAEALPQKAGIEIVHLERDGEAIRRARATNPRLITTGANLAYVMYTSGSSGKPKGVQIEQRSVVRLVKNTNYATFRAGEVMLQYAPISFDASTLEIWGALLNGGRLAIAPAGSLSPAELGEVVQREKVTTLWLTAGLFNIMVKEQIHALAQLRQLLAGGDVLLPENVRATARILRDGVIINGYGPTENTTFTCCHPVLNAGDLKHTVPIGRPIAKTTAWILDEEMRPVASGESGELYTGGEGLARCYQNKPDLTASRFVPNPFAAVAGERLYRTGDRVCLMLDGNIEFLGRIDNQVKIRGYRIEPGEIEAVLTQTTGVQAGVVVARESAQATKRLVAYVVPSADGSRNAAELRNRLANKLPEYMLPSQFVFLDQLPLTPEGKVDRRALPDPDLPASDGPLTETEQRVAALFAQIIGVETVPLDSDFLELGGSSLNATQAVAALRDAFHFRLSIKDLLMGKSMREIAREIDAQRLPDTPPEAVIPRAANRHGLRPASFSQERVWFIHRMDPASLAYHFTGTITLTGELKVSALEQALGRIVERHEIYRTTLIEVDGELRQQMHEPPTITLPVIDVEGRQERLAEVIAQESKRPFNLGVLPLVRWTLVRLGPRSHVLLAVEHHIVHDGWSFNIFLKELTELYRFYASGTEPRIHPAPLQFADFAEWQKNWINSPAATEQLQYWKEKLADAPPVLALPYDRPRPPVQSYRGGILRLEIDSGLYAALTEESRRSHSTLFMLFAAAFQVVLFRYSGQKEFCIGTGIANRQRSETRDLIGMLVNNIALRLETESTNTLEEVVERMKAVTLEAYARQDVPFDKVVQAVDPVRDLRYNPIFQVLLSFHDSPLECPPLDGLHIDVEVGLSNGSAKFDLNLIVVPPRRNNSRAGAQTPAKLLCEYNSDLFDLATVQQMMTHYLRALDEVALHRQRRVADVQILSAAEREQLIKRWNQTSRSFPGSRTVHALFEEQVRLNPQAIAMKWQGCELTYDALNRQANQMQWRLRQLGVSPETRIGICMVRGPEMLAALLAILKADCAYVPLDLASPIERLNFMLQDAAVPIVITTSAARAKLAGCSAHLLCVDGPEVQSLLAAQSADNPPSSGDGTSLAYLMYTSGSTGTPKGVEIEHRNIVRLVRDTDYVRLGPSDRVAQAANAAFDAATFEIWGALLNGGCIVGIDKEEALKPGALKGFIEKEGVTAMFLTTAFFNQVAQQDSSTFARLHYLFFGGEAVDPHSVREVLRSGPPRQLTHVYGPTEATTFSTWYAVSDVPKGAITVPIGGPLANAQLYVLDDCGQLVPPGAFGELYIGGEGIGRGYLGRPALTAEKFVPDSFSGKAGARLYKTGDVVRWLRSGAIEFSGRIDQQVKIRGFRIELGEIESVLRRSPLVRDAAVALHEAGPQSRQLVAYVVSPTGEQAAEDLQKYLRQTLPEYMVPRLIWLDAMPLNANGKVDRKRLPLPDWTEAVAASARPVNATQELLEGIWARVLQLKQVGIYDNFFELGGHSLLLMQMSSRIRQTFGVEISIRDLFENPHIAGLAKKIGEALKSDGQQRIRATENAPRPLSFAQQRLWFLHQYEPDSPVYNVPLALRISGPLNTRALEFAMTAVVGRHEALRTTFSGHAGSAVQVCHPAGAVRLPVSDLQGHSAESVRQIIETQAHLPFNLAEGPVFRALLLHVGRSEHVLVLCFHHIAIDGWSLDIFARELAYFYGTWLMQEKPSLDELPSQYADYAVWQREWLSSDMLEEQLGYWRKQLAGAPELLELPMARPRPAVQSNEGAIYYFNFANGLAERIKAVTRAEGTTLFMNLLAGFLALLWRYTRQDDLVIGTPVAGRIRPELEGIIGCFVNTLVLRTKVSGKPTLRELLKAVRETAMGAYANQDIPFEKLVEELQPVRDLSHTPLFQVLFTFQNFSHAVWNFPGLQVRPEPIELQTVKFDLGVTLLESGRGLGGYIGYRISLFERQSIERMAGHLEMVLSQMSANMDLSITELELLSAQERQQIVSQWSGQEGEYEREQGISRVFERQVRQTPSAIALRFGNRQWSYDELNRKANQLARCLQSLGVSAETHVAICVERSLEMIAALLAILKAGAAYVPLDATYPRQRLEYMLDDCGATLLLTVTELAKSLPHKEGVRVLCLDQEWPMVERETEDNLETESASRQLAYAMYTSGSTGQPKGVEVEQRSVVRLVRNADYVKLDERETLLQLAPISFDAATFEIWGALLNGGKLVIAPPGTLGTAELGTLVKEEGVTTLWLTAGLFHVMVEERLEDLLGVRQLLAGGDVLLAEQVRNAAAGLRQGVVINGYGPTENTTFTCCYRVKQEEELTVTVPIGQPIRNTSALVLDEEMRLTPVGVIGELFAGGDGLARGYMGKAGLTAEKFVPHPYGNHEGERLYRTGDLARYREDGIIEFLGRADQQVKVRGYRVELGEIESALAKHESVRQCAVLAREDAHGHKLLVAYVVLQEDLSDTADLKEYLRAMLPDYMVPGIILQLQELPISEHGKLDRKKLLALADTAAIEGSTGAEVLLPRDNAEFIVTTICEEILGARGISVKDNFFDRGGHSVLALVLANRLSQVFRKQMAVRTIFENPTIESLAAFARNKLAFSIPSCLMPINSRGSLLPFFCVHPGGGSVNCYLPLARALGNERPFYGIQSYGMEEGQQPLERIEEMAELYIKEMRKVQPSGPYQIGGFCLGGSIAYEMAQQLQEAGEEVSLLVLMEEVAHFAIIDVPVTKKEINRLVTRYVHHGLSRLYPVKMRISGAYLPPQFNLSLEEQIALLAADEKKSDALPQDTTPEQLHRYYRVWATNLAAKKRYRLRPYSGRTVLLRADPPTRPDPLYGWGSLVEGLSVHCFKNTRHHDFPELEKNARQLAAVIKQYMEEESVGSAGNSMPVAVQVGA